MKIMLALITLLMLCLMLYQVSNACNTDFRLFIVLGDKINVIPNIWPYTKAVFKGKYLYVLCFVLINKASFIACF